MHNVPVQKFSVLNFSFFGVLFSCQLSRFGFQLQLIDTRPAKILTQTIATSPEALNDWLAWRRAHAVHCLVSQVLAHHTSNRN